MGHPEPFQLEYVAIGNEDCGKKFYKVRTGPLGYQYADRPLLGGTAKIDRQRSIEGEKGKKKKKKRKRRKKRRKRKNTSRRPRPRVAATLARGSPASRRRPRSQFFSLVGRKIEREKKKRAKKREKKRENLEPVAALSIPIRRLRAISLLARSIACG
ncbi:hypothetical protein BHE74_00052041 [Ensete ventricosum]|nr:hypothetical protein BHE74_00052041 [Ensete ventricosum]